MSKPLHVVICFLAFVFTNRIECIKLTRENVVSLRGVNNNFGRKQISEIDPLALEGINSTTLILNNNKLTYLQEDLFQYNTNFEELHFYGNKISKIHPLVFQKLQNLTHIYLYNNELTEIAENFFGKNTKLMQIYLYGNRLTFLHPNAFKKLKKLTYLDVSSNQLESFDFNLLSSNKELQTLHFYKNNLTEINYHDLKSRFPKLETVSFTQNKFNCSFAKKIENYLDRKQIDEYDGSISCIRDEEYAAIMRDRQINTRVSSQGTNMELSLEEQCSNITMALKNVTASMNLQLLEQQSFIGKVKNDSENFKIDNEEMKNVIKGLKLQLLEKETVIEKAKDDNEDMKCIIKGLKLQLIEQQPVTEKGRDDSAKVKSDIEDMNNVIEGLKLQLQVVTEKVKNDNEKVKIDNENMENVIKGLKSQLLEQQSVTDQLKSTTESCCQKTI